MNAESLNPKITKGQQTSLRIQLAAVDLVLKHGVGGTTVEQICQAAEVSERTFFNHFKTKELAIIGDDMPKIDEVKARQFLAAPAGDIFTESLALIAMQSPNDIQPKLMFKRLEMMAKYPELFALNMTKMLSLRAEHVELIYLRLRRNAPADMSDAEVRSNAGFISEIVASYLRTTLENSMFGADKRQREPLPDLGSMLAKVVELGRNA